MVGTLFFLIPYNLLMYGVNDVFDYESDLRNPRKGGTEGALLEPGLHRVVVWTGIVTAAPLVAAMLWLGGTGHPWSWVVLAVSLFAVFAYSVPGLRFKERPVLDSITSSTHFVSPAVYGLAVAGAVPTPQLVAADRRVLLLGHGQPRVRRRAGRRPRPGGRHRLDRDGLRGAGDGADRTGALARRRPAHARDANGPGRSPPCSSCRTSSPRGRTVR